MLRMDLNTTAFVGPSGSGKSTTIGLLQRFYDLLKGSILLDEYNTKFLNIQSLRSLTDRVQQELILFNLSIPDNTAYGDNSREVTRDDIENAARMANIHQLIISLSKGTHDEHLKLNRICTKLILTQQKS
ncbi:unnamed protein product [Adineta steineri]|uniref:ABC transporter domain-containing protein n=1 Tax=Adineta steineri TaxID=433720 RepID=A0A813NUS2_9BILA|nr:unnamed protein product [Adineta steineri]CAF3732645.1 unnamed protein product [Adineta steineri]